MPNQEVQDLCARISQEQDTEKVMQLIDELIKVLGAEQDAIKLKINANLGRIAHTGTS
jgi:hypothetical protein